MDLWNAKMEKNQVQQIGLRQALLVKLLYLYKGSPDYDDGLSKVFSWPVATETVDATNFKFTLSNGDTVFAHSAGRGYSAFYNPGGPGPEPFEGVRYTSPGPADMEPVIIAIDDPMRVNREAPGK